jgi:hypothetical protein
MCNRRLKANKYFLLLFFRDQDYHEKQEPAEKAGFRRGTGGAAWNSGD